MRKLICVPDIVSILNFSESHLKNSAKKLVWEAW